MARKIGNKHTLCRRVGEKLCNADKCPAVRRPYPPGIHGPAQAVRRPKLTAYGLQLREKQKAKFIYGLLERQFSSYVADAIRRPGDTTEHLMRNLELRLDNAIFRLGLAKTRTQARQLTSHGHFTVNGTRVTIPSYRLRVGDAISIRPQSVSSPTLARALENPPREPASWLSWDSGAKAARVETLPSGQDLQEHFDPKPIIEFYSR